MVDAHRVHKNTHTHAYAHKGGVLCNVRQTTGSFFVKFVFLFIALHSADDPAPFFFCFIINLLLIPPIKDEEVGYITVSLVVCGGFVSPDHCSFAASPSFEWFRCFYSNADVGVLHQPVWRIFPDFVFLLSVSKLRDIKYSKFSLTTVFIW